MSYREENDQVILTMSRDDYAMLLFAMAAITDFSHPQRVLALVNRLNEGNPGFTPYQISTSSGQTRERAPGSGI